MTSRQLHIIFVPSLDKKSLEIQDYLKTLNVFLTETKRFDPAISWDIGANQVPVVFICLGDSDSGESDQLEKLLNRKQFFQFPIIIYGEVIEHYSSRLEEAFPVVVWCNPGQGIKGVLSSLSDIEDAYVPSVEASSADQPVHQSSLGKFFDSAPDFDLTESDLGHQLTKPVIGNSFNVEKIIENEDVRQCFGEFTKVHSRLTVTRVQRVIGSVKLMQKNTDLWKVSDQSIEAASALYLCSCKPSQKSVLAGDYLGNGNGLQKKLADQLSLSAKIIEERTGDSDASGLVEDMGLILQEKKHPSDSEKVENAAFLVGMDLLDRSCWSRGLWDAKSAKRLMNTIVDEAPSILSTRVAWVLVKLIVNAFENITNVQNIVTKTNQEAKTTKLAADGSKKIVALSALKPGMVLKEALYTRDGTEILPKNFELDGEIIYRLWNLVSSRALHFPQIK